MIDLRNIIVDNVKYSTKLILYRSLFLCRLKRVGKKNAEDE